MSLPAWLLLHAGATWALCGLIWTVQVVHYPLFAQVGADAFPAYHARHTRRITWVVAPLMGLELVTAVVLWRLGCADPWFRLGLIPLAFNWLCTWRVQVPLHARLAQGFDPVIHRRLVTTNGWRTLAWSLRAVAVGLALR